MNNRTIVRLGGLALVAGAVAFMGVFSYLAAAFNYPEVLGGAAVDVLPQLLATGATGRAVWAFYAFLPLIWLPAAAGAQQAMGSAQAGMMRLATLLAGVAAVVMMLGLMRWPTIHWELAQAFATAGPEERRVLEAIFDGLNTYLGNYLGEFLGEMAFSGFFVLTGVAWLHAHAGARWVGWLSVITGAAGWVGMFRNVTAAVAPIAALNNYLLPLGMIVLGVALMRVKSPAVSARPVATVATVG